MNDLVNHRDRIKWNQKYTQEHDSFSFAPSSLLKMVFETRVPDGPVLELACGLSGSALELAQQGREVLCVDISDVGLCLLQREAEKRGLTGSLLLRHADLQEWTPPENNFALVLCTFFWDRRVFERACLAVICGGVLAWEAFTREEHRYRPSFRPEWCLSTHEPAVLLPPNFKSIKQWDCDDGQKVTRRLIAVRSS